MAGEEISPAMYIYELSIYRYIVVCLLACSACIFLIVTAHCIYIYTHVYLPQSINAAFTQTPHFTRIFSYILEDLIQVSQ